MLIRKCAKCGREIQVSLPYSFKYVYYKNKWYCTDCFTAITTPRILKNGWFDKTSAYVLQEVSKDDIDRYFKHHYNLSCVPSYIYIKLDSIYKGKYKGLACPIPPDELLDILLRKQNYIDGCLNYKSIDGVGKINYALAVAVGSYDSYKRWKEKNKAEQEKLKKQIEDSKIWKDIFTPNGHVASKDQQEEVNFSEMFDEYEAMIDGK